MFNGPSEKDIKILHNTERGEKTSLAVLDMELEREGGRHGDWRD